MIVGGENNRGTVGALRAVHSVHLGDACNSLCKYLPGHLDSKVVLVLLRILSRSEHQRSAVRHQTIENLKKMTKFG